MELLDSVNLDQNISKPTHHSGHTLHFILTRPDQAHSHVDISDILLSDHSAVTFSLPISKPPLPRKELSYRRIKAIDVDAFVSHIEKSRLFSLETVDPDVLADTYNSVLREILNQHAPLKTNVITIHPTAPWYSDDIMTAKKEWQRAEKKWREAGLVVLRQIFKEARVTVTALLAKSKVDYYSERIDSSDDSQKILFACIKELLNENKPSKLPSSDFSLELANRISMFFHG